MKSKFTYLGLLAIAMSACTTGSYVSSSYTDDIYFNPGEVPPPIVAGTTTQVKSGQQTPDKKIVVSEITENADGTSTTNNYIFDEAVVDEYPLEQGIEGPDTLTYYEDGELQQVINNYYDDDGNVDYAYRIQQFHNPYFYDPFFYDSWYYDPYYYSPGWSFGFTWGWGYPYYGYGWGYPYYGYGYPYYGYGYPGYYPPYYGGGYYPPIYADSDTYQYGQRRSEGTNVTRRGGGGSSTSVDQSGSGRNKSAQTDVSGQSGSGRSTTSSSGRRDATDATDVNSSRTKSGTASSNVLTEKRRSGGEGIYSRQSGMESSTVDKVNSSIQRNVNAANDISSRSQTQSYSRPGSTTQTRSYTRPSSSSSGVNTQPRIVSKSAVGSSSASGYSQPKSTSTYNQAYRSSSTYNRSSSTGTSSRSYSSPSSSGSYRGSSPSSSGSYSSGSSGSGRSSGGTYSGSSGSGSYSGGGASSGGGGASSGGGGGSRSSGGGSSSSGRR